MCRSFDPSAGSGCCAPAPACDPGAAKVQSASSCCAPEAADGSTTRSDQKTQVVARLCRMPANHTARLKLLPSNLHALAEPSKSVALVGNDLFTDVCCSPSDLQSREAEELQVGVGDTARFSSFWIGQMCCPSEQTMIEGKLARMSGIQLEFNMMNRTWASGTNCRIPWVSKRRCCRWVCMQSHKRLRATHLSPIQRKPSRKLHQAKSAGGRENLDIATVIAKSCTSPLNRPEWVIASSCSPSRTQQMTRHKRLGCAQHTDLINAGMSIAVNRRHVKIGQWPEGGNGHGAVHQNTRN